MTQSLLLPILRHVVAALLALLIRELFPEGEPEGFDLMSAIDALTLIIYAAIEKLLKPLWRSWLKEQVPGDTPPPSTPKLSTK